MDIYIYIVRNLKLYLFYFILLLPITAIWRNWISMPFDEMVIDITRRFLFGSTFVSSWYITASIIGLVIISIFPQKYNWMLIILSLCVYLFCCLESNYYYFLGSESSVVKFMDNYNQVFCPSYNSFPVSLIWMSIGKIFAQSKIKLNKSVRRFGIVLFTVLLYIEFYIVLSNKWSYTNDCYITLVPLCVFIFSELKETTNFQIKNAILLRKMSIIVFALHGSVSLVVRKFLSMLSIQRLELGFLITLSICLIASVIILQMEKVKYFHWLKYAH